jgi:large subunit ribosomal protein L15
MQTHQLKPARGSTHVKRRVGRGNASGVGTYSGRGLKGQKARAGNKPRRFFEGGQTRLLRRLPRKKGFFNRFRVEYEPVNLSQLNKFEAGTEVTPELLKKMRILRNLNKPVKVLAMGEIDRVLTITANRFSMTAKEKIVAAGGTVIELDPPQEKPEKAPKFKKAKAEAKRPEAKPEAAPKAEAEVEPESTAADGEEADSGDGG